MTFHLCCEKGEPAFPHTQLLETLDPSAVILYQGDESICAGSVPSRLAYCRWNEGGRIPALTVSIAYR